MPEPAEEATKLWSEVAKLLKTVAENRAYVAIVSRLQKKFLRREKIIAELLPVTKKSRDLRLEAERKARSAEMELPLTRPSGNFFNEAVAAVNRELFGAWVNCAALWWNRDKILLKGKVLETDLEKLLKRVSEWTTEGSSVMSKPFDTEVIQGLERISLCSRIKLLRFQEFKDVFFAEFAFGVQRKIANCVAVLFDRVSSVREASSVKPSAFMSGMSPAATSMPPSVSAVYRSEGVYSSLIRSTSLFSLIFSIN